MGDLEYDVVEDGKVIAPKDGPGAW